MIDRPRSVSSQMVSLDQPPAMSIAARRIRHIVPCTMMALDLVALDHADVEEPGIFAVHDVVHQRAVAVAVLLRRLHQADARDRRTQAPDPSASPAARHSRRR